MYQGRLGAAEKGWRYFLVQARGEYKESNPRTEYELHKEGVVYVYKISKTEYDFAVYLVEHGAAS